VQTSAPSMFILCTASPHSAIVPTPSLIAQRNLALNLNSRECRYIEGCCFDGGWPACILLHPVRHCSVLPTCIVLIHMIIIGRCNTDEATGRCPLCLDCQSVKEWLFSCDIFRLRFSTGVFDQVSKGCWTISEILIPSCCSALIVENHGHISWHQSAIGAWFCNQLAGCF
jgi:hypothetical protein